MACSSDECLAIDYQPDPIRLRLTDADGNDICTEEVIATPVVTGSTDAGEDVRPLEVVTYEEHCEHRVYNWFVDGEALSVVVTWESEDGETFTSDVVELPVERNACGELVGSQVELELQPVPPDAED